MGVSRIHLHIDRLVLNGLQSGQDKALVESLRAELSQILSNRETRNEWAKSRRTPVLKLGRMQVAGGPSGAKKFGAQIARGIGRGIKA